MRLIIGLLILVAAGFAAYVRLAPVDVARWHVAPPLRTPGDTGTSDSFTAVRTLTAPAAQALQAVADIAVQEPRTRVLAGDAQSGMITFETRSRLWGFPDYTTVVATEHEGAPVLMIHARLRFGKADLGVNKARVQAWLAQMSDLVAAP